jgi:hypothetical protein
VSYVHGLADAPGSVNETATMVREILETAPSRELPPNADGYTIVPVAARWMATNDGRGPDRAA